jgi:hypothetical protein
MIAASRMISSNRQSGSPFSMSANVRASASTGSAGPGATVVDSGGLVHCLTILSSPI